MTERMNRDEGRSGRIGKLGDTVLERTRDDAGFRVA